MRITANSALTIRAIAVVIFAADRLLNVVNKVTFDC